MNPIQFILAIGVFGCGIAGLLNLFSGNVGLGLLFFMIAFMSGTIGGLLMKK